MPDDPADDDERISILGGLDPSVRKMLGYAFLAFMSLILLVLLFFSKSISDAYLYVFTIGGIVLVASFLYSLQSIQFSIKTLLIGVISLQLPIALLLTAKSIFQTNLGVLTLLIWISVILMLIFTAPKRKD